MARASFASVSTELLRWLPTVLTKNTGTRLPRSNSVFQNASRHPTPIEVLPLPVEWLTRRPGGAAEPGPAAARSRAIAYTTAWCTCSVVSMRQPSTAPDAMSASTWATGLRVCSLSPFRPLARLGISVASLVTSARIHAWNAGLSQAGAAPTAALAVWRSARAKFCAYSRFHSRNAGLGLA